MAKLIKKLSDVAIEDIKPTNALKTYSDGDNLNLMVSPTGAKFWWFFYRFGGKRKPLSLGQFPAIKVKKARILAQNARNLLAQGQDPNTAKKLVKYAQVVEAENSFEKIANEWLAKSKGNWTPKYHRIVTNRLEQYIFPELGKLPINKIDAIILEAVLKEHEKKLKTYETINRVNKYCSLIFRYGMKRKEVV